MPTTSFKSACTALPQVEPQVGEALLQDEEDHVLEGHGCQASKSSTTSS